MTLRWACALTLLAVSQSEEAAGNKWEKGVNENGQNVQTLKIEAPSMTEEDQYGYNMPDRYKCNSCRAVMFHLAEELIIKQPKARRLKQWEYVDAFDETCRTSFKGYGIKLVNGENVLSGPGLKDETTISPGMGAIQMGGESWTKRLQEMCRKLVFEKVGEEEVYEHFYKRFQDEGAAGLKGDSPHARSFCVDIGECSVGPEPPKQEKKAAMEIDDKGAAKKEKAKAKEKSKAKAKETEKKAKEAVKKAKETEKKAKEAVKKAPASADSAEKKVDVQTFLRDLAVRHGLTAEEYLTARSMKDWEKLTLSMASRLYSTVA